MGISVRTLYSLIEKGKIPIEKGKRPVSTKYDELKIKKKIIGSDARRWKDHEEAIALNSVLARALLIKKGEEIDCKSIIADKTSS